MVEMTQIDNKNQLHNGLLLRNKRNRGGVDLREKGDGGRDLEQWREGNLQ